MSKVKQMLHYLTLAALMIGGLYLVLSLYIYFAQSSMVFLPQRSLVSTPDGIGLAFEEIHTVTSDSVAIHGWFVPALKSRGTLLFSHGNAGNISHRLQLIQLYRGLGLDVLIYDYRGYGKSEGKPDEQGTYRDIRAIWNYMTNERMIPPDRIIVLGRSLGAALATHLAFELAEEGSPSPAGVMLESPFTSIPDMGAELYPFLPIRLLARIDYNNVAKVRRIHVPLLVVHSVDDEITPFRHGEAVFAAANEPKTFVEISGSHDDAYFIAENRYLQAMRKFVEETLPL